MNAAKWLGLALQISIMLTLLGFGMTATWQEATYLLRTPKLLARTVLSMNIIMPIVAAVFVSIFALPVEVRVALVSLAVSPVPPLLHKSEIKAGGRREFVVGLMVAMSLLAIVLVPLTVVIYDRVFNAAAVVTPLAVMKIMLKSVILPLLAGLLIRQWFPSAGKATRPILAVASVLLVVGVVLLLYALWPITRSYLGNGVGVMLAIIAAIGLGVGHFLGGPLEGDRTVLALSTASRHPAMALAIATSGPMTANAAKPELAAILLYVVIAAIVSFPYKKWRMRRAGAALHKASSRA
jgi:bile acid:Na+ symporter, BASS family